MSAGLQANIGNVIVRTAVSNALTQGIGVVTGLQQSFSWKAVAAAAVGAGVGQGMNSALGLTTGNGLPSVTYDGVEKLALASLSGLVAGTAAAVMRGGRLSVQQVATDAFGNALGQSLASVNSSGSYQGLGTAASPYVDPETGEHIVLGKPYQTDFPQVAQSVGAIGDGALLPVDRSNDVMVAAGDGVSLGRSGVREEGVYVKPDGTRVMVLDATGLSASPSCDDSERWTPAGPTAQDGGTLSASRMTQAQMGEFDRLNPGLVPSSAAIGATAGVAASFVDMTAGAAHMGSNLLMQVGDLLTGGLNHEHPMMQRVWAEQRALGQGIVNAVTSPRFTATNVIESTVNRYNNAMAQGSDFNRGYELGRLFNDVGQGAIGLGQAARGAARIGAAYIGEDTFIGSSGGRESPVTQQCAVNFGALLKKQIGDPPTGMIDPHAHHVLFKEGNGITQKALVVEGQEILRRYNIDPVLGPENLVSAPNRVAGQHGLTALSHVVDELKQVDEFIGTRQAIVQKLKDLGQLASRRK